jgi:ligand-binding sensor domain-containing protein
MPCRGGFAARLTLAVCLLLVPAFAGALDPRKAITQYAHQVWKTDQGLPQNSIQAILQTRDGYIWLGTERGLVRFDGGQFTVFDKSTAPGLRNTNTQALYQDRDGTLWVGTWGGLQKGRPKPRGSRSGAGLPGLPDRAARLTTLRHGGI